MPRELQDKLRRLLDSPDFNTLLQVIEGRALDEECEALEDMAKQASFENYTPSALAHLKEAQKHRIALEILKTVQSNPTHRIATSITPFTS